MAHRISRHGRRLVVNALVVLLVWAAWTASAAGAESDASAASATAVSHASAEPSAYSSLQLQIAEALERADVPAAALVIVDYAHASDTTSDAGEPLVLLRTFGTATPSTPFRLGSITKTFTALGVLRAAARNNLSIDTALHTLLPGTLWDNPWRNSAPITPRHLIELSAGFGDLSAAEFASAEPVPRKRAFQQHRATHITHWPPGTRHSYTNLAPAYSAELVEHLTGQEFESFLKAEVLSPLGMPSATLSPMPHLPGGYTRRGVQEIPYWHTIYPAFGALNATPSEFANFLLKLIADEHPLFVAARKQRGRAALYEPTTTAAASAGLTLGYGAGLYGWETNGFLFAGHGGDADGYRSKYAVLTNHKRGYLIVINTDDPGLLRRLQRLIERALSADLERPEPQRLPPEEERQAIANARAFVGTYYPTSRRFDSARLSDCQAQTAVLSVDERGLVWRKGEMTRRLIPTAERLFRFAREVHPSVALVQLRKEAHVQGELGNWRRIDGAHSCAPPATDSEA